MMYYLDNILIRGTRLIKRSLYKLAYPLFIKSHKVYCPICFWKGPKYLDYNCGLGNIYKNAECPRCLSHPRHRLVYLLLKKILTIAPKNKIKILHVAPERALEKVMNDTNIEYLSIDLNPKKAMRQENLERLTLPSNHYDVIICLAVLEHVKDDRKAIRELRRVLKETGICIIDTPVNPNVKRTYEDQTITGYKERISKFGQYDHLRMYGRDFIQRLKEAGLKTKTVNSRDVTSNFKIRYYGLPNYPIFLCSK